MSHAGQGGIGVCMVVLLGRDRLPRRRGHGLRFGVPPVRLPGREHREAARGALPGPALSRARVVVLQRRLAAAAGQRRRVRHGGLATRAAAVAALEALASPAAGPEPGLSTGSGSAGGWRRRCTCRTSRPP